MALHFASDLHLGTPDPAASRERERVFLKWLDDVGSQGDGLHLVGDSSTSGSSGAMWCPRGPCVCYRIESRGGGLEVHWHLGNHDMWTRGYLADELGVRACRPIVLEHAGHRCMVGHGDGLGRDRKYKALKRLFRNPAARWAFARCT